MDKTPKERIVFDEGVYYGDEGSEISIEDIASREGITEAEVLKSFTEEEIFENAMDMMDIDRTEELDGLRAFLDGSDNPLSSYDNPLGGNRIIVRGSIERWDGTSHGMTAYKDFDDMMGGADSVFKDCEIGKVWDENGSLFIHGYHHDGGVDVEVRQLTDAGEEALDSIEDAWVGEAFTSGGKEYDGSLESMDTAMRDLWENPDLCPAPRYMELAFGCSAEEYEAPASDTVKESPVSLKDAAEEAHAVSTMLSKKNGGTDEQDGKYDLQRHMIPAEMRIPSQNDHHRAPSLSDMAAETRAASAAMETNIASRIDRERDAR